MEFKLEFCELVLGIRIFVDKSFSGFDKLEFEVKFELLLDCYYY